MPVLLEEGLYPDAEAVGVAKVGSLKYITDDLTSPEMTIASSTDFNEDTSAWCPADKNVQLIKCVSVGGAGVWAVKAKDDTVWCRMNETNGKATGKVAADSGKGDGWTKIQASCKFMYFYKFSTYMQIPDFKTAFNLAVKG